MSHRDLARRALQDERGNITIMFGAIMVPVIMLLGGAIDFGKALHAKTELQGAADAAALAAAILTDVDDAKRIAEAERIFSAKVQGTPFASASPTIEIEGSKIGVAVTASVDTTFLRIMNISEVPFSAYAKAQSGYDPGEVEDDGERGTICLLALDPASDDGIHVQGNNYIRNPDCWGYTNSTKATAINGVGSQATAIGEGYCAAGGYVAEHQNYSPEPATGCQTVPDPYATTGAYGSGAYSATFAAPAIPTYCKSNNLNLKKGNYTLEPGRYCGGITLQAHAKVTMMPGVYIIDDGLFKVQSGASLSGTNTLIYYSGANARMTIIGGGTINLKGRSAGSSYEGYLMIAHPDAWRGGVSNIQGGGSFNMEGVIYMPTQRIEVSGEGDVNGSSPYFGMIAKDFYFRGNGMFYLKGHSGSSALTNILPEMPVEQRMDARLIE
jgi:hypothetical protein